MDMWRKFAPTNNKVPDNCQICLVNLQSWKTGLRVCPPVVAVWYDNKWWVQEYQDESHNCIGVFYPSKVVQDSMNTPTYRCFYCNPLNENDFWVFNYLPFGTVSVEEINRNTNQISLFEEA